MEWWSYGDSLSAGADVLRDRGPGEGHQTAAGGMGKKNLKVLFQRHISSIVFNQFVNLAPSGCTSMQGFHLY